MNDFEFIKSILPDHYTLNPRIYNSDLIPDKKYVGVLCKSNIGIKRTDINEEDEEHWGYILKALRVHFNDRLLEIYHNTNHCHVNFIIYYNI